MIDFQEKFYVSRTPNLINPWFEITCKDHEDINNLMHFVNLIDNNAKLTEFEQPFYFRGQANSSWTLKPKMTRILEGMKQEEEALKYEYQAFEYFRERVHLYIPKTSIPLDDTYECLCLMQHYSAPTRLLDWTTSFWVALYFSVFEIIVDPTKPSEEVDGAVWIVPTQSMWSAMEIDQPKRDWKKILSSMQDFIKFGTSEALPTLTHTYRSDLKSERVTIQRGVFTFNEKLDCDQANVIGTALMQRYPNDKAKQLCKLIITSEQKKHFRRHLTKLNVSAATLFPGIDGLGKSITEILQVQRETFKI